MPPFSCFLPLFLLLFLGICTISEDGVEADDVIATLVNRACKESRSSRYPDAGRPGEEKEEEEGGRRRSQPPRAIRRRPCSEQAESTVEHNNIRKGGRDIGNQKRNSVVNGAQNHRTAACFTFNEERQNVAFDEVIVVTSDKDLLQVQIQTPAHASRELPFSFAFISERLPTSCPCCLSSLSPCLVSCCLHRLHGALGSFSLFHHDNHPSCCRPRSREGLILVLPVPFNPTHVLCTYT